jgi:lipopolysaccharide export system permease protein
MLKLTGYVAKTVLYTTLIVCAGIMSIFLIITFISQAGDIGSGKYSAWDAFLFSLYQIPINLYLILPMSSLLGCLMGLGLLANNSELIVMRSAGMSIFQISKGVIIASLVIIIVCFGLGAFIGPLLAKQADIDKTISTNNDNAVVVSGSSSLWLKDKNSFIHINRSSLNGSVFGVTKFSFDNNQLNSITTAESGKYFKQNWKMKGLKETDIKQDSFQTKTMAEQEWQNFVPPSLLNIVGTDSNNLTIIGLWDFISYNSANGQNTDNLYVKFWQMIFQPLSVIILMLIAVPFVFGPMRSSAMGYRAFVGLLLGFIFFIVNQFFGPFSEVYGLSPFIGAATPTIIFLFLLVFLFWKMKE